MAGAMRKAAGYVFIFLITLSVLPAGAAAAVVVFDRVTSVGKPVFVKAVTRGYLFTKGGRRVSFRVDNTPMLETLSGADGAAFLKFHPDKPGIRTITATSENEEGTGTVLVLGPGESVVVIGVEGGLQKSLFSETQREKTLEVVNWLSNSYRLVYLTRWVGVSLVRDWLKKEQFPSSVVLRWRGEEVFRKMKNSGVPVAVVIGSGALLESAPDSIDSRFTFDKDHKAAVNDWQDIRTALEERLGKKTLSPVDDRQGPSKP